MSKFGELLVQSEISSSVDECIKATTNLFNEGDNDKYQYVINSITQRIINMGSRYFSLDLIYTLEESKRLFKSYLWEHMYSMLNQAIIQYVMGDSKYLDRNNPEEFSATSNQYGYGGYSAQNQEGTFEKTSIKNERGGGNLRLSYVGFFNTQLNNFVGAFIEHCKEKMIQLIY